MQFPLPNFLYILNISQYITIDRLYSCHDKLSIFGKCKTND